MKTYNLQFAGLRTVLRTPFEITISDNLRPFLCREHHQTDCTIELQSCDALPVLGEGGVWHGPEYYDCQQGVARVFHCNAPKTAAFAVTELFENGNIRICVLPEYLSYFSGSEGILNRIGMETLLLQNQGFLLHASLIKYKMHTVAFAGPSGVGKSTQAELWQTHLGAQVLNGDRAAVRRIRDGWMAYGSPCAGTSGIYCNDGAPLAAVVLLEQGPENRLCRLHETEAFRRIYPEMSVHHWDKFFVAKATDRCLQLLREIPVYLLCCRPEENAALLVKKGLGL